MIVACAAQKGGVGKTTLAVCLATESLRRGMRVLLVDADVQHSALRWGEIAVHRGHPAPRLVAMGVGMHRADQLPAMAGDVDLVVIDCPPRLDLVLRSALVAADVVLIPHGSAPVEAWALGDALDLVTEARLVRPELALHLVISRRRVGTVGGRRVRGVLEAEGLSVLDAELYDRIDYPDSLGLGLGPSTHAPDSPAAREVRRLVDELDRRHPFAPPPPTSRRRKEG